MMQSRAKVSAADDVSPRIAYTVPGDDAGHELSQEERESLVKERQDELIKVLDSHDNLIREQFHLEKYVSLLWYDPVVAKQDQSTVFLEYKDKYDLVMNTTGAGPSRKTRRAQNDRLSVLTNAPQQSSSVPVGSSSSREARHSAAASSSVSLVSKSHSLVQPSAKGKQRSCLPNGGSATRESLPHISSKARGKLRMDEGSVHSRERSMGRTASFADTEGDDGSISAFRAHSSQNGYAVRRKRKTMESLSASQTWNLEPGPSASNSPTPLDDDDSISSENQISDHNEKIFGRRKKNRYSQDDGRTSHQRGNLSTSRRRGPSTTELARPTISEKTVPTSTYVPSLSFKTPKRIKLIVREPPPSFSSPRQRPDPKRFNGSLDSFLMSWVELDGKAYGNEALDRKARHDARILEKAETLRKKGRLLDYGQDQHDYRGPAHTPNDLWANVVAAAISKRSALSRHRFGFSGQLAGNIASRLKSHWDTQVILREREEIREIEAEKQRLRGLAWSALQPVLVEWKEVVRYVREEKRLELEAEEKRRGVLHLDAILDQSGQILEKQQMELGRAESASTDEDEDEDEGEEEEDDDDDEEATTGDEDQEEFDEEMSEVTNVDGEGDDMTLDTEASTEYGDDDEDRVGSRALIHGGLFGKGDDYVVPLDDDHEIHDTGSLDESTPKDYVVSSPEEVDINPEEVEIIIGHNDISPDSIQSPDLREFSPKSNLIRDSDVGVLFEACDKASQRELDTPLAPVVDEITTDILCLNGNVDSKTTTKLVNGFCITEISDKEVDHELTKPVKNGLSNKETPGIEPEFPEQIGKEQLGKEHHQNSEEVITKLVPDDNEETDTVQENLADRNLADAQSEIVPTHDDTSSLNDTKPSSEWEHSEELQPYAIARGIQMPDAKVSPPLLLRGTLRPYQQSGLEWLVTQYKTQSNGILADEMGLGKTIQTITLLAHLACDWGIWGPHLIIVPTSVLLNWEMEFKKFLPGFKVLSYHGSTKRRKELRQGWNNKHAFNVCVTSYTLASKDQHIFRRKSWFYMILDEAHMIKNYKSQRWNILLNFKSYRRLLLTGTPLQNNLIELWALLKFLVSGTEFANQKEFKDWFSGPLERAIEQGTVQDQEVQTQVTKLHSLLRPRLLRRLKRDVEKELPSKYEHLVLCRLSKRQRYLYDEFMSRAQTREDLKSGVYQKIANILMQLRKVCNHPDLFEVRPIVTSFAMERSAIADYEIKELLIRRRLLCEEDDQVNLDVINLRFTHLCDSSLVTAQEVRSLEEPLAAEIIAASPGEPPPRDLRTIEGFRKYHVYRQHLETSLRYQHFSYLNRLRCQRAPMYSLETLKLTGKLSRDLATSLNTFSLRPSLEPLLKSYARRATELIDVVDKFAFATSPVVTRDLSTLALKEMPKGLLESCPPDFDSVVHRSAVKLQIAFPDTSLLQYDCGKLQELASLLRERKSGGHRVLIFTQMTRILDILEIFLNYHGYLYLRLDGATKIEDRQYITERFNVDTRIFVFIASSRSGGVGINLTGADTVIFYDSDFNPQMDRQCEDRAHRIGQIRDVHIYRFISQHTVEEAMLRKANQKRSLDDLVIQQGEFDWRNFFRTDEEGTSSNTTALQKALVEFEDFEDARAAKIAASEEAALVDEDLAEFGDNAPLPADSNSHAVSEVATPMDTKEEEEEEEGGHWRDYMLRFVRYDFDFFRDWKV